MIVDSLSHTRSKGKQQLSWPDMFIIAALSQLSARQSSTILEYSLTPNTTHAGLATAAVNHKSCDCFFQERPSISIQGGTQLASTFGFRHGRRTIFFPSGFSSKMLACRGTIISVGQITLWEVPPALPTPCPREGPQLPGFPAPNSRPGPRYPALEQPGDSVLPWMMTEVFLHTL